MRIDFQKTVRRPPIVDSRLATLRDLFDLGPAAQVPRATLKLALKVDLTFAIFYVSFELCPSKGISLSTGVIAI